MLPIDIAALTAATNTHLSRCLPLLDERAALTTDLGAERLA